MATLAPRSAKARASGRPTCPHPPITTTSLSTNGYLRYYYDSWIPALDCAFAGAQLAGALLTDYWLEARVHWPGVPPYRLTSAEVRFRIALDSLRSHRNC